MEKFINGFESWQETHYEIVSAITSNLLNDEYRGSAYQINENSGQGGLYDFAKELTDKFEEENKNTDWDIVDFFDVIELFLEKELN